MDATCNGVQILSLLLKDEEIGEWTNLVPQDKPKDLYQEICDHQGDQKRVCGNQSDLDAPKNGNPNNAKIS